MIAPTRFSITLLTVLHVDISQMCHVEWNLAVKTNFCSVTSIETCERAEI